MPRCSPRSNRCRRSRPVQNPPPLQSPGAAASSPDLLLLPGAGAAARGSSPGSGSCSSPGFNSNSRGGSGQPTLSDVESQSRTRTGSRRSGNRCWERARPRLDIAGRLESKAGRNGFRSVLTQSLRAPFDARPRTAARGRGDRPPARRRITSSDPKPTASRTPPPRFGCVGSPSPDPTRHQPCPQPG